MPWNKDDGGGNNQGPWGQGPWGQGPKRPQGGGRGPNPPDLDELLRRGQDKLKQALPQGGGRWSWVVPVLLVAAYVLYNSVYQVQPDERGVVLRFGQFDRLADPGLHFAIWPVETMEKPKVGAVRQINIGSEANEGQMLTMDKNIISVPFTVQWRIANPRDFLFNVAEAERTISALSQSAMREVAAQNNAQVILTTGKNAIAVKVMEITQGLLDRYEAGVMLTAVNLGNVQPPGDVADAFSDVVRAEQDKRKLENEATQYRNQRVQAASGESSKLKEEATAYKARVVADAEGQAARFLSVYNEYKTAKDVTRERLFLETMEAILSNTNKVLIEEGAGGNGVVPYLPLPEIQKNQTQN